MWQQRDLLAVPVAVPAAAPVAVLCPGRCHACSVQGSARPAVDSGRPPAVNPISVQLDPQRVLERRMLELIPGRDESGGADPGRGEKECFRHLTERQPDGRRGDR